MYDALSIMKLTPHLLEKVWGGNRLGATNIGEALLISDWQVDIDTSKKLPFLVKLIDTADFLSIQVHPDDTYAKKYENSSGKSECWIILDAAEGAGIYLGLKNGVKKTDLQTALQTPQNNISQLLNFFPVTPGDFFAIPPGSIHAIGKDVFLAEIQQNSDITYRVWDWNRTGLDGKPRLLHITKALDVINFQDKRNSISYFNHRKNVFNSESLLIEHPQFSAKIFPLKKGDYLNINKCNNSAESLINLQGKFKVQRDKTKIELDEYEALFIPFTGGNDIKIEAKSDCRVLHVF